jgi:hypothetical protein
MVMGAAFTIEENPNSARLIAATAIDLMFSMSASYR